MFLNSFLLSAVLLAFCFAVGIEALSWTVRFRSFEANSCYYINVPEANQTISLYYNVHESKAGEPGHLVDYTITGPNGQQIAAEKGINYKDFKVQAAMAGRHSVCFKHSGSPSEKVIDIDASIIGNPADPAVADKLTGKEASPTADVERVNRRVKEDLSNLFHSLLSMKDREKGNQRTVKSILGVVKWFSFFQCITFIGIGFAHVYVLKTFFSNNAKTRV